MRKGRRPSVVRKFPKGKQNTWSQQKTFMMLSDRKQEQREPFLFGNAKALFGQAKYAPR